MDTIDFVSDPNQGCMENEIKRFSNLAVIKSMSKAFGICGIRLGYMASADEDWVKAVRCSYLEYQLDCRGIFTDSSGIQGCIH